jgi:hypothetical protein
MVFTLSEVHTIFSGRKKQVYGPHPPTVRPRKLYGRRSGLFTSLQKLKTSFGEHAQNLCPPNSTSGNIKSFATPGVSDARKKWKTQVILSGIVGLIPKSGLVKTGPIDLRGTREPLATWQ